MRKPLFSLLMIVCTVLASVLLTSDREEPAIEAKLVAVSRRDVHKVVAIEGRLAYAEERMAYAHSNGVIDRIDVVTGQRVGAGEALLRLKSGQGDQFMTAYAQNADRMGSLNTGETYSGWGAAEISVVRADNACTVRQVLVQQEMPVTAGTPVMRLSSNVQEIRCPASKADLALLRPGMWAWITSDEEPIGFAKVSAIGDTAADKESGMTYALVILEPEQHIDLPEGAAVSAEVYLAGSDDVLALPLQAITDRETVWWVDEGRCTEISAEIVMSDEMHAWVALPEGLQVAIGEFEEGQRIVEASE